MANIIPLKDNTGAQFYPQTHEKAVVDSNGVNLQTKLASITTPTYVTAWDGDSTPVVANIPSGVTVTYGGTSYTGTLVASASTANKTYLVGTGTTDNYNRYVTQLNGSTYSWQNIGSTEIDLSDYATKDELNQLDQKVDEIQSLAFAEKEETISTNVSEIPGVVKMAGYNAGPGELNDLSFSALAGYDSYYFYPASAMQAWLTDPGVTYIAFSVIQNAQPFSNNKIIGTNPARYRKSEGNLPTSSSPLSIPAGSAVAITVTAGAMVGFVAKQMVTTFNGNTPLAEKHIEQVEAAIDSNRCSLSYNGESTVNIYIPTRGGFIEYIFSHDVDQTKNADIWRVSSASLTYQNKVVKKAITTPGEWEAAIHLAGRDDFSGGISHGDEIFSAVKFFADGAIVDMSGPFDNLIFNELVIFEVSTMYDPADGTTAIATHTSEHIFNDDGLRINQSLKWLVDASLTESYMAMFPVAKAVTDSYCSDKDFTPRSIVSGSTHVGGNVSKLYIWSELAKVLCEFSVGYYRGLSEADKYCFMNDNGTTSYNKCYFYIATTGTTVTAGTVWKTETRYKIMADAAD